MCVTHLDSYQGSAGFEAPFVPYTDVGPFFSPLYLFLSSCELVRDSYDVVHRSHGQLLGSHSTLTLSSLSVCRSLPFYHLFVSYLLNRGAIRREGDAGESWGCPELYRGCCSHCRGHIKCVHFHPTYGFGL